MLWHSALTSCLMNQNPIWVLVYVPMIPLSDQFLAFHLEKQRKMAQTLGLASMWETEKFPCSWLWMGQVELLRHLMNEPVDGTLVLLYASQPFK